MIYDDHTNKFDNPVDAVNNPQAIVIGGGNTFHLWHQLYQHKLICVIQETVDSATPYIGWSAGSNVSGVRIYNTNDMPIIELEIFNALNLVPFQLNPHYTDFNPPGHNSETREQRLAEFTVINVEMPLVGIVEGNALKLKNNRLSLLANKFVEQPSRFSFKAGNKRKIELTEELSFYFREYIYLK